jgi:UDP-N-acetylglucosamine pyrophosphorylase
VRKELINLKKEQTSAPGASGPSAELTQKIELMDEQLRKITQYLANQSKQREQVVKAVVPPKEKVNIINETSPEEEVEYEEVTDDEAEADN